MTITIDASTPTPVTISTVGPTTTASFTPPAGSLIVVPLVVNNSTGSGTVTATLVDSLGSTWTALDFYISATGSARAALYGLDVASATARTVSLTGAGGTNAKGLCLSPLVLNGAEPCATCLGNTVHGSGITVSLNIGTAHSMALGACGNNASSVTWTAQAASTLIKAFADATNGSAAGTWRSTSLDLSTGAQTFGLAGTITAAASHAGWEIKQAVAVAGIIVPDYPSTLDFLGLR